MCCVFYHGTWQVMLFNRKVASLTSKQSLTLTERASPFVQRGTGTHKRVLLCITFGLNFSSHYYVESDCS